VVGANLLAMEKEAAGEILNIGSGRGITVNEIAALIAAKLGSPLQPLWGAAQPGEVAHSIANIAKAQRLLGYQPRGRLQEDLDEIIAWQKRHPAFSVG
jgi:nucleoside-diphosphate-sugar epimerase